MVPSVCFTVPPPNKEAIDVATKTEQLYQNVLSLWHHSHVNMRSVVAWHHLMADIRAIHNWNVASIKTMLPGEHQQVIHNLQIHFGEFVKDSKESEVFTVADCAQLERDVATCKEYYEELLRSAEREEHQESVYNHYISEIRNFRMHLEAHEEHLIRQIRTPLERDDLDQSLLRITEQEKKMAELAKLKEDFDVMKDKCEVFIRQAVGSSSASTLSSELTALVHSMNQVHSMSFIYMDKLKTVSLVLKHSQSAEMLVKSYESKLYEEDAMNSDLKSIDTVVSTLKQWRTEIDEQQEVFHDMEDELQKARVISDRMFKAHNERDFDLDWHKEKADQLSERWQSVHSQIDSRLRDLDGISKSLKHYKESYSSLDEWIKEMETVQLKAQENKPEDSKALAELLNKQKVLVGEIEQIQGRIDECQKYSEQYSTAVKDYELQLMTFRAMVDSQHKSPLKKRRMQSSADAIQQEFMDLRTRYTALVTLMTQYVKFASETLKRTEEEERSVDEEKREHGDKVSKLLHWMSNVKQNVNPDGSARKDSNANTGTSNKPQVSMEDMVTKKEQIAEAVRITQAMLNKHSEKMTDEERAEAEQQLKELNQAYSDLSQHCASLSADEMFKSDLNGVLVKTTHQNDNSSSNPPSIILDKYRTELYENMEQYPTLHQDPGFTSTVNASDKCLQSTDLSSVFLPELAATLGESTQENSILKMIELKDKRDGLQICYTGDTLSLDGALHTGLIPASVYIKALQQQKHCPDLKNASAVKNVPESDCQEVNAMILNCLKVNKSVMPDRNTYLLKLSDQGRNVGEEPRQTQDHIAPNVKVDASVQCDLMNSSSTLIVLGNQFIGVVLPPSGETVSTSLQVEKERKFSSKLLGQYQKIVALYIPEISEVLDIDLAVKKGYIDSFSADILKTIEIPDELLDIDNLNKEYSSWLTYIKHRSEGQLAPLQLNFKIPSPSEAKLLFVSYLKMNTYIDPKSGQRILILDKQMTNMIKIFLENPSTYESICQTYCTAGTRDAPLEINEEEESDQEASHSQSYSRNFVSSASGNISFNENERDTYLNPMWADFKNTADDNEDQIMDQDSSLDEFDENALHNQFVNKTEIQTIETTTVIYTMSCSPQSTTTSSQSYLDMLEKTDYTPSENPCIVESHYEEREIEDTIYFLQGQDKEKDILDTATEENYKVDTAIAKSLLNKQEILSDSDVQNVKSTLDIPKTALTWKNDQNEQSLYSSNLTCYEESDAVPKEELYNVATSITFDRNKNSKEHIKEDKPSKKTAVLTLETKNQDKRRERQETAALMEHGTRETTDEISRNLYAATPCISAPDTAYSRMTSPFPGSHVTAQSFGHIDKKQNEGSLSEDTGESQPHFYPIMQSTLSNEIDDNEKAKSQIVCIPTDNLGDFTVLLDQTELDIASPNNHLYFEETRTDDDLNAAETMFNFELVQDYSSPGDLVRGVISGSSYDSTVNQRAVPHSGDSNVESARSKDVHSTFESEMKQLRNSPPASSSAILSKSDEDNGEIFDSPNSTIDDEERLVNNNHAVNIDVNTLRASPYKKDILNSQIRRDLLTSVISDSSHDNNNANQSAGCQRVVPGDIVESASCENVRITFESEMQKQFSNSQTEGDLDISGSNCKNNNADPSTVPHSRDINVESACLEDAHIIFESEMQKHTPEISSASVYKTSNEDKADVFTPSSTVDDEETVNKSLAENVQLNTLRISAEEEETGILRNNSMQQPFSNSQIGGGFISDSSYENDNADQSVVHQCLVPGDTVESAHSEDDITFERELQKQVRGPIVDISCANLKQAVNEGNAEVFTPNTDAEETFIINSPAENVEIYKLRISPDEQVNDILKSDSMEQLSSNSQITGDMVKSVISDSNHGNDYADQITAVTHSADINVESVCSENVHKQLKVPTPEIYSTSLKETIDEDNVKNYTKNSSMADVQADDKETSVNKSRAENVDMNTLSICQDEINYSMEQPFSNNKAEGDLVSTPEISSLGLKEAIDENNAEIVTLDSTMDFEETSVNNRLAHNVEVNTMRVCQGEMNDSVQLPFPNSQIGHDFVPTLDISSLGLKETIHEDNAKAFTPDSTMDFEETSVNNRLADNVEVNTVRICQDEINDSMQQPFTPDISSLGLNKTIHEDHAELFTLDSTMDFEETGVNNNTLADNVEVNTLRISPEEQRKDFLQNDPMQEHFSNSQIESNMVISGSNYENNNADPSTVHQCAVSHSGDISSESTCTEDVPVTFERELQKQLRVATPEIFSANVDVEPVDEFNAELLTQNSTKHDEETFAHKSLAENFEVNTLRISPKEELKEISKDVSMHQPCSQIEGDMIKSVISGISYDNNNADPSTVNQCAVTQPGSISIDSDMKKLLRVPTPEISCPKEEATDEHNAENTMNSSIDNVQANGKETLVSNSQAENVEVNTLMVSPEEQERDTLRLKSDSEQNGSSYQVENESNKRCDKFSSNECNVEQVNNNADVPQCLQSANENLQDHSSTDNVSPYVADVKDQKANERTKYCLGGKC
ncbi:hypothetical protein NQD34_011316 [Periophthalmus magnuspinnatus]|nr:hypothetical protein NQD34_011316 [Periophthalmus magnuspinnatus]